MKRNVYTTDPKNCICRKWDRKCPDIRALSGEHHRYCRIRYDSNAAGRTPEQAWVHLGPPVLSEVTRT